VTVMNEKVPPASPANWALVRLTGAKIDNGINELRSSISMVFWKIVLGAALNRSTTCCSDAQGERTVASVSLHAAYGHLRRYKPINFKAMS
jgi:hypothetical protein